VPTTAAGPVSNTQPPPSGLLPPIPAGDTRPNPPRCRHALTPCAPPRLSSGMQQAEVPPLAHSIPGDREAVPPSGLPTAAR
jgi:hypothetical protein